jgi:hypothetical protein
MQPRCANGAGRRAQAIDHRGCLRRRMWPLAESAGSPCMWLGRRRSCGMAGMRASGAHRRAPRMGRAQIPALGTAGQVCHDLRERHAAGFGAQRLRCARGLAQRRGAKDPHPLIRRQDHRRAVRGRLPAARSDHARFFRLSHVPALLAAELGNAGRVIVLPIESPNDRQKPQLHEAGICQRRRGNPCIARYRSLRPSSHLARTRNRRRRLRDCPCAMSSNEKHEQPRPGQTQSWPPDQRRSNACP